MEMIGQRNRQVHWGKTSPRNLRCFYPFRFFLRFYALNILVWDVLCIVFVSMSSMVRVILEFFKPPPLKSLTSEIAMVVGSSRGVGKEIVKQLVLKGAIVICVDINPTLNETVVLEAQNSIPNGEGKVWNYICDVTKREDVMKMSRLVRMEVGEVTMLFHCCGIPSPRSMLSEPPSDVYVTMNLTVMSHFWLLEAFLPSMKENDRGHIVALTSVASLSGQADQLPLSVAQFAVQGLSGSLMEELRISKNKNVHVTMVHIYPFIVSADLASDIRFRIPSYFGTIDALAAAKSIVDAVRRNYEEVSIPRYLLPLGHVMRVLPRRATTMVREHLDTGIDFG